MDHSAQLLLTIGSLLLLGFLASTIARKTLLPRVTLLLLFGTFIGKEGFDLIPEFFNQQFSLVADMTLLMVGFLLGGKITKNFFNETANQALWISISAAVITATIVCIGMIAIGLPLEVAIISGCIASATDPAAIMDVIKESNVDNRHTRLLFSIVALDDIWALILFAIGMAICQNMNGVTNDSSTLLHASIEIFGSILLGIVIGIPGAYFTGRAKKGKPVLTEAIGIVFVCGGLSMWLDLSYIITAMVMGAVITNIAKHHEYPFHAIDNIESPFLVIFFILAGASLELETLKSIGLIGISFILLRVAGKVIGARIGGYFSHASKTSNRWLGAALLPQAGVAIGMALVASNVFQEYSQILLTVAISSTIIFEIIGPIFTHIAIKKLNKHEPKSKEPIT